MSYRNFKPLKYNMEEDEDVPGLKYRCAKCRDTFTAKIRYKDHMKKYHED